MHAGGNAHGERLEAGADEGDGQELFGGEGRQHLGGGGVRGRGVDWARAGWAGKARSDRACRSAAVRAWSSESEPPLPTVLTRATRTCSITSSWSEARGAGVVCSALMLVGVAGRAGSVGVGGAARSSTCGQLRAGLGALSAKSCLDLSSIVYRWDAAWRWRRGGMDTEDQLRSSHAVWRGAECAQQYQELNRVGYRLYRGVVAGRSGESTRHFTAAYVAAEQQ